MKKFKLVSLILVAVVWSGKSTDAAPVSLQLTLTPLSEMSVQLASLDTYHVPVSFIAEGTIDITLDDAWYYNDHDPSLDTTSIQFNDAQIRLPDASFHLEGHYFRYGVIEAHLSDAGYSFRTTEGPVPLFTIDNPNFLYAGISSDLSIDQGTFTYEGISGDVADLEPTSIDFSTDPLGDQFTTGSKLALLVQEVIYEDGNPSRVNVNINIPISFDAPVAEFEAGQFGTWPIWMDLSGTMNATGSYLIPEPSSFALLALAVVCFLPFRHNFLPPR